MLAKSLVHDVFENATKFVLEDETAFQYQVSDAVTTGDIDLFEDNLR